MRTLGVSRLSVHRTPRHIYAQVIAPEGDKVLLVVDGRQPCWSIGINLPDLARMLKEDFGCTQALNLDGGGSSALYLDGKLVNRPSDGTCRAVSNGICLWALPAKE